MFKCQRKEESRVGVPDVPDWAVSHSAWLRLENQLDWYDGKSLHCQRWYKYLKILQITLAVGIPVASHMGPDTAKWATSIAGALIAILEGIQHMNQYSTLWVTYRSTAEYLKHEKFLFLSAAGQYKGLSDDDRLILLAERVEERASAEHANWFNEMRRTATSESQKTND